MNKKIADLRKKKYPGRGGATLCAEAFGVGRQYWYDWESGKKKPGARNQQKIATFFNITLAELRGEEKPSFGLHSGDEVQALNNEISKLISRLAVLQTRLPTGKIRLNLLRNAIEAGNELLDRAEGSSRASDQEDTDHNAG